MVGPLFFRQASGVFSTWLIEKRFLKSPFGALDTEPKLFLKTCASVYAWQWWVLETRHAVYIGNTVWRRNAAKAISVQRKVKHGLLVENMWIADGNVHWTRGRERAGAEEQVKELESKLLVFYICKFLSASALVFFVFTDCKGKGWIAFSLSDF